MGLLDNQPTQTPAQRTAASIRQQIQAMYGQMGNVYKQLFASFWSDPVNVAAALGTDAADLFRLAGILVTALNSAKPGSVDSTTPSQWSVTANTDGSVTIAAVAPAQSAAKK